MTKPLYMWAGGKSRMLKKYANLLGEVSFDKYIEPFFGAGAMFIWAYEKNPKAESKPPMSNSNSAGVV